jgi:hypothetical protein
MRGEISGQRHRQFLNIVSRILRRDWQDGEPGHTTPFNHRHVASDVAAAHPNGHSFCDVLQLSLARIIEGWAQRSVQQRPRGARDR